MSTKLLLYWTVTNSCLFSRYICYISTWLISTTDLPTTATFFDNKSSATCVVQVMIWLLLEEKVYQLLVTDFYLYFLLKNLQVQGLIRKHFLVKTGQKGWDSRECLSVCVLPDKNTITFFLSNSNTTTISHDLRSHWQTMPTSLRPNQYVNVCQNVSFQRSTAQCMWVPKAHALKRLHFNN